MSDEINSEPFKKSEWKMTDPQSYTSARGIIGASILGPDEPVKYSDLEKFFRWELRYNNVHLALLNRDAPDKWRSQLLAFKTDLKLAWRLIPNGAPDADYITEVFISEGHVWASSWAGYLHRLDTDSGLILETKYCQK